ncbi:MAG: transcription termination factor Rho, partial [Planctomycetes bacterium]|nr:transcription termination factor Rho [Planctomycetota bacterium]
MPDAKGVEGSPLPRPSLRAAVATKRPFRKPTDGAGPAAAPPAPAPAPAAPPPPERAERPER